jgi:polar amino acid transport system permease protein
MHEGAGGTRLPRAYLTEVPQGSIFELLAAWLLVTEGALALLFAPVLIYSADVAIPPGDIATFVALGGACIAAGALLYTRWAWSWWFALIAAIATIVWLVSDKGLTSWAEVSFGAAFAVVEVVFLLLGRAAAGKPDALSITSARIPFRLKLVLVWGSIFFIIGLLFSLADFDTQWMRDNIRYIAGGITWTLFLAIGAIVLAVVLALLGALGRLSRNPVAYGVSGFYTSFFRGTPLIVQLFLIYLALPQIGGNFGSRSLLDILTLTTFQAGVLGLGLNYGAYMTEIFRAGIQSVGHGQAEAADALGMSYPQRMRRVVLPQAARVIIPPTGNEFIAMMKDTALVSFLGSDVARAELFRRAQQVGNADLRRLEAFAVAAGMYWALTAVFTFFQARLERRISKGYVRTAVASDRRPRLLSLGVREGHRDAGMPPTPGAGGEPGEVPTT